MKVSIVLSTYNGEEYIAEQLESLRKQTLQPDEVLIFDDCSMDGTVAIIRHFIEENSLSTWRLIQNDKNKGWKQNFKDGILSCKGDLIFPCDQDDIWFPTKLADMENAMINHPKINVLVSHYIEFYKDGTEKNFFKDNDESCIHADWHQRLFNVLYPGCTFCIRRSYLPFVSQYWGTYAHDAFLWRFAMLSDSAYILRKPLIHWRKHSDSTFQKDNRKERNYQGKLEWLSYAGGFLDDLIAYVDSTPIFPKGEKIVGLNKYKYWISLRKRFYQSGNPILGLRLIRYLYFYSRNKQYIGDWIVTYVWRKK